MSYGALGRRSSDVLVGKNNRQRVDGWMNGCSESSSTLSLAIWQFRGNLVGKKGNVCVCACGRVGELCVSRAVATPMVARKPTQTAALNLNLDLISMHKRLLPQTGNFKDLPALSFNARLT